MGLCSVDLSNASKQFPRSRRHDCFGMETSLFSSDGGMTESFFDNRGYFPWCISR